MPRASVQGYLANQAPILIVLTNVETDVAVTYSVEAYGPVYDGVTVPFAVLFPGLNVTVSTGSVLVEGEV
ncbi:hypothetical protein Tdes44962_MAKER04916 [Teratosphaeria destructans]|uniref:Uncharacterized protein n=1 Tax=Teratosphaeria destructans TaxID=418781 RepID=A0A9W7SLC3_9PEZI|nr:hypothetical protein Tdes44962_MAKER04916 [Teratosphaeria destructans]